MLYTIYNNANELNPTEVFGCIIRLPPSLPGISAPLVGVGENELTPSLNENGQFLGKKRSRSVGL